MANINIGGRLHSTATGNTVAGANEILDDSKGKKQSVINQEIDEALAGKQAALVSGTNIKTINNESILGSGNITAGDPNAVKYTEQSLTDSQKTQARTNVGAGTYTKPSGGVPKTDLASGVQGSLDLADSALQYTPSGEIDPEITPADYATQEELSQLEATLNGFVDISGLETKTMYPDGANWLVNTNYKCKFLPCTPGKTYTITANNNYYCGATFVKAIGTANGQPVQYATGYSSMVGIVTGTTRSFVTPSDAVYLCIQVLGGGNDRTPTSVITDSIVGMVGELETKVNADEVILSGLQTEQKPGIQKYYYFREDGKLLDSPVMRLSECLNIPTVDCTFEHLWQDAPTYGYGIVFIDEHFEFVANVDLGQNGTNITFNWVVNSITVPAGAKYILLQSQNKDSIIHSSETLLTSINPFQSFSIDRLLVKQNILAGKKWVACGDSWTAGDFTGYVDSQGHTGTESDAYDPIRGMYKTYPWWIAERNDMALINEAVAGTTMTTKVANSFSDVRYANVPLDADYITLMFGLNEVNQAPGTSGSTDKSTLWGAWNFSLEYLITNIPKAKIGIIIPDGWMAGDSSQTCRETMIDVAKAWGIPYLDLTGDPHISLGVGGRISSLDLKTSATVLRDSQYKLDNNHPNLLAHEMRSTYIEAFLRSL